MKARERWYKDAQLKRNMSALGVLTVMLGLAWIVADLLFI